MPPYGSRNFRSLLDPNSTINIIDILSIAPASEESFGSIHFITSGEKVSLFELVESPPGVYIEKAALPMECNLVENVSDVIYLSGISDFKSLNLLRYNGELIETVYSLSDPESEITSMKQFGDYLYIGCLNGDIYKFDGNSLSFDLNLGGSISFMVNIGSLLYILVNNSNSFYVHNGVSINKLDIESNIIN